MEGSTSTAAANGVWKRRGERSFRAQRACTDSRPLTDSAQYSRWLRRTRTRARARRRCVLPRRPVAPRRARRKTMPVSLSILEKNCAILANRVSAPRPADARSRSRARRGSRAIRRARPATGPPRRERAPRARPRRDSTRLKFDLFCFGSQPSHIPRATAGQEAADQGQAHPAQGVLGVDGGRDRGARRRREKARRRCVPRPTPSSAIDPRAADRPAPSPRASPAVSKRLLFRRPFGRTTRGEFVLAFPPRFVSFRVTRRRAPARAPNRPD